MEPADASLTQRWAEALARTAALVYAITLFNPSMTAWSNTSLYLGAIAGIVASVRSGRFGRLANLPVVRWMLLAAAALFVAALNSPDRAYSLNAFRKEWLEVVLVTMAFGSLFRTPCRQAQLLLTLGIAAAMMAAIELLQYAGEFLLEGGFSADVARHRWYADSLIFYMPAALSLARLTPGRSRCAWSALLGLQLLLLAATSSRGAWLGAALCIGIAVPLLGIRRRIVLGLVGAAVAAVVIAAQVLPSSLTDHALSRGLSTTLRDQGTWGPSYEMIAERPLLGFGYGKERFHAEFNRRAPERPWWSIRESVGPHSTYLQILFSAGLVGFVPFVVWIATVFGVLWRSGRTQPIDPRSRALCYAAAGALVACYLVRGFVEVVRWAPLGLIAAISVGFALQYVGRSAYKPKASDSA